MRPQKVNDQHLVASFMAVLKNKGFDGASLNELAAASGLQKASLYHRFPGGKEEIAFSVFQFIDNWLTKEVGNVFENPGLSTDERLDIVLKNIDGLYKGGVEVCFIRSISFGTGKELYQEAIEKIVTKWITAFYGFGRLVGQEEQTAKENAEYSFILVQGSLVLSNALGQPWHFQNALKKIAKLYK